MRITFQFRFSIRSSVYVSSRSDYKKKKKKKNTPYNPIEILIRSGQLNPIDVFTLLFYSDCASSPITIRLLATVTLPVKSFWRVIF